MQLASVGGERFDWLVGAYYFSGDSDRDFFLYRFDRNPLPLYDTHSTSDDTLWALYGHATWHFADGWGVTGGLRYCDEAVEISSIGTGLFDEQQLVVIDDDWDHLSWRVEYSYRSKFYYTQENSESESQGAHGLLNLLLHFEPASGSWYGFATGLNLADEDYFHQVLLQSTPGYPDTYEVGLGFRF